MLILTMNLSVFNNGYTEKTFTNDIWECDKDKENYD